jgi:hypothetical protein
MNGNPFLSTPCTGRLTPPAALPLRCRCLFRPTNEADGETCAEVGKKLGLETHPWESAGFGSNEQ